MQAEAKRHDLPEAWAPVVRRSLIVLKALTYDIERNLRAPLAGIAVAAGRLGLPVPTIAIATRTGDTTSEARRAPSARPDRSRPRSRRVS